MTDIDTGQQRPTAIRSAIWSHRYTVAVLVILAVTAGYGLSQREPLPSEARSAPPPAAQGGRPSATTDAPPSAAPAAPVGVPGDWRLILNEPFNTFNEDIWMPRYQWTPTVINNELQAYLPSAVTVDNGILHLTATEDDANGQPYTSGVITSYHKFAFRYGVAEMRANVPAGRGLLPAFWMLANNDDYPPEVDIIEVLGSMPNVANLSYYPSQGDAEHGWADMGYNLTNSWHTYSVLWEPGLLVWYVDGKEIWRYQGSDVTDQDMYLLANLAVGGDWPGWPDDSTPFPADMAIDYIRVWQHN